MNACLTLARLCYPTAASRIRGNGLLAKVVQASDRSPACVSFGDPMCRPKVTATTHTLPFDKLSPRDFERLCLWLVKRNGWLRPEHLGEAGSEQGRDVVAWKAIDQGEQLWFFQCKRYKSIGPATLNKGVDKYNALPQTERPHGIVFVTNAVISKKTRDAVAARCREHGYACEFWTHTELDERVKACPEIVREWV